jgi:hypothetical protein
MRPLRSSINIALDGCCDHCAILPDKKLHRHHEKNLERVDAVLLGRVTYEMMEYEMMEAAWRSVAEAGERPDWMPAWMVPFARTIHTAKTYVWVAHRTIRTTLLVAGWHPNSRLEMRCAP